jgi:alcohol dehydrogenase YqhD (iron-dependent ADH family)
VKPNSTIICTFGGGSIDKNGCRKDVETVLSQLKCNVQWEGGIQPNPDVSRCKEIIQVVKKVQPDLLLAVGGGSVIDATKFICLGAKLPEGKDSWDIVKKLKFPDSSFSFGTILTLSASGSEGNN